MQSHIFFALLFAVTALAKEPSYARVMSFETNALTCYKSKPLGFKKTSGCGKKLPPKDKCLMYISSKTEKRPHCQICDKGYVAKYFNSSSSIPCAKSGLNDRNSDASRKYCVLEFSSHNATFCYMCNKGHFAYIDPETLKNLCLPKSDKRIKKRVPGCSWGRVGGNGTVHCGLCKNRYYLNARNNRCVLRKKANKGCLIRENKKCELCNAFKGYGMKPDGTCAKW